MSEYQRLYYQYYDKNRNPISHFDQKNNSIMISSAYLFSNMKIDFVNLNHTYDKKKSKKIWIKMSKRLKSIELKYSLIMIKTPLLGIIIQ